MIRTLLLILLLKVTASAAATTHYDSILHKYYVDIAPKVIILKMPPVTRLYVNYDTTGYVWDLLCTPDDTNRFTIKDGFKECAVRSDSFEYIATELDVTIVE